MTNGQQSAYCVDANGDLFYQPSYVGGEWTFIGGQKFQSVAVSSDGPDLLGLDSTGPTEGSQIWY